MATTKDYALPGDLMDYLRRKIPGFRREPLAHQWALARMFYFGSAKRRRHREFEGAMSFGHQELAENFGRDGFAKINERLGLFRVSEDYGWPYGEFTKGYWFTDRVHQVMKAYHRKYRSRSSEILYLSGQEMKAMRKVQPPLSSLNTDGQPVSLKEWNVDPGLALVKVDLEALHDLRRWLLNVRERYIDDMPPYDLFSQLSYPPAEVVDRLMEITTQVLQLAEADLGGRGYLPQRYAFSPSGRVYGMGVSLQNTPSLVKEAALQGCWEYDFSNCHYTLLAKLSDRYGLPCPAIEAYLGNKDHFRLALAEGANITLNDAKQVMIKLIYGARESLDERDAIPREIGAEAAALVYQRSEFRSIKNDILRARRRILAKWPRTANGSLTNASGRATAGSESVPKRLAHLLQGAEAKALMIAYNLQPEAIMALQHDGFATRRRLKPGEKEAIEDAVEAALGCRLVLEEKQLRMNPHALFEKYSPKNAKRR